MVRFVYRSWLRRLLIIRAQPSTINRAYSGESAGCSKPFEKILIANRGEIACRVMRTAKKMGIRSVAIYSEADAHSLHVQMADEVVCVGPALASQSYLNINAILEAIRKSGAQAVHPGYGFLSENFHFCQALDEHGVTFIGPSVEAMAQMGDKIESKIIAKKAGLHTIPGFDGLVRDDNHAIEIARKIGYPVMIKASAGGGGKGMRIAWNDEQVRENFKIAATESKANFGDDRLLVEKYIEEPRHVEIQVLGDKHGNIIYLPERECSIQRRNQKVIEETPSMALDARTRKMMGEQAVQLAKMVGYSSAGTVEFLVDKNRQFYFLEMNTRLQVEHPITEYVTGIDLVEQMIRIAAGHKLQIKQSDVKITGWAFESRVYAEDPKLFLPSIGKLTKYIEPLEEGNPEIRCDSGIREGSEISIYYDPLICKLCTHGKDRNVALSRMTRALDSYVIRGVTHNIPILREVLSQQRFQEGRITTNYLPEEFPQGFTGHKLTDKERLQLITAALWIYKRQAEREQPSVLSEELLVQVEGEEDLITGRISLDGLLTIKHNQLEGEGSPCMVESDWKFSQPVLPITIGGEHLIMQYHGSPYLGRLMVQSWGTIFTIIIRSRREYELQKHMIVRHKGMSDLFVKSPMAGQIVSVSVAVGDVVREGAEVVVMEAMKMQNVLRSLRPGKVTAVHVNKGQGVAADQLLVEMVDL